MKKKLFPIVIFLITLTAFSLSASDTAENHSMNWDALRPLPVHSSVEQAVGNLLATTHYKKRFIDDNLSSEMFDFYLESIDNGKFYFLQSDIDSFEKYRLEFDDAMKSGDLSGAYVIFNKFREHFKARHAFILKQLESNFDFTIDEYFNVDREDERWAETESQLDELWRKRIKNEMLSLRLAGKGLKESAETLRKRYNTILTRIGQTESEDVFNLYMNAFAETFDPHTSYMSPKMSDDFRIQVSKSLEGIGASLQTEDEFTKVVEIVPGGPADKSGLLHPNDRIVGVGQDDDGEMVDVIGWRIDDVVQLIRGPKDSKVRLQILPTDAPLYAEPKEIEIIRDKVKLADRMAKSRIEDIQYRGETFKIGIIEIPDFYFDYESMQAGDPDYPSTTRDVQKLLADLKNNAVDGIVIDLRDNGGGFLSEAIGLTGLFIKDGPVVQVRDVLGRVSEQTDKDSAVYYEGPLAVLVDRLSASASEIFAAAIQDYDRGIVVGSRTFGKGTVQSIVSLDRVLPDSKEKLGQIKLTIAKFYRINGSSTQHVGVTPDFEFPSRYQAMDVGESNFENALRWDQIKGTEYHLYSDQVQKLMPNLVERFQSRINDNPEFIRLRDNIDLLLKRKENTLVSLQEAKRKKENEEADSLDRQRESEAVDEGNETDIFIAETEHILGDYVLMTRTDNVLALP